MPVAEVVAGIATDLATDGKKQFPVAEVVAGIATDLATEKRNQLPVAEVVAGIATYLATVHYQTDAIQTDVQANGTLPYALFEWQLVIQCNCSCW